jgi:Trypsin-like peptidase domain
MVETLLLTVVRVSTMLRDQPLTNATGFFFANDGRLFLVTSRHVVLDERTKHHPDRLDIELHVDPANVTVVEQRSIPLYLNGQALWREASDTGGLLDVATIEIDPMSLPPTLLYQAFSSDHLVRELNDIEVGARVLVAGFPLGFHDELHRLPVTRQAVIASSFGLRFQGQAYFLTDARLHRGMSGAPVVARRAAEQSGRQALPWYLLGIHSARMDMSNRDATQDERLDLNCAWYADALLNLT